MLHRYADNLLTLSPLFFFWDVSNHSSQDRRPRRYLTSTAQILYYTDQKDGRGNFATIFFGLCHGRNVDLVEENSNDRPNEIASWQLRTLHLDGAPILLNIVNPHLTIAYPPLFPLS